jgi:chromate reductase
VTKVGIFVGSLRKNSFSEQIAKNVAELFPAGYTTEFIQIDNLPFYNEDYDNEGNVPESYTTFRNKMKEIDAVLFVTPEYNRSIPAVLKNALDVGSRPMGDSVWDGKPAAIISQSPANLSGFGANHHLRQPLVFLNMPVLQQPEIYLANVAELLDENGKINRQDTVDFLQSAMNEFVELIKKYK